MKRKEMKKLSDKELEEKIRVNEEYIKFHDETAKELYLINNSLKWEKRRRRENANKKQR